MSIIPVVTVVTVVQEMHSADQCPLTSPEINIWLKDSSAKYEVKKRAPKFDFAEALPLMYVPISVIQMSAVILKSCESGPVY